MPNPVDPFETTGQDFASSSSQQLASLPPQSSRLSTIMGAAMALVAITAILAALHLGKIEKGWHALLAIVFCALPGGLQLDLLKFVGRRVPFLGPKR